LYSIEDGSVRLEYSRNPHSCVIVFVSKVGCGFTTPRPSLKQIEQSSK
jgi:hypothetical protein